MAQRCERPKLVRTVRGSRAATEAGTVPRLAARPVVSGRRWGRHRSARHRSSHLLSQPGICWLLPELPVEALVVLALVVELHQPSRADLGCRVHVSAAASLRVKSSHRIRTLPSLTGGATLSVR